MAMAADIERVFSVGPVFRAEKSFTTRHLTEYASFELNFHTLIHIKMFVNLNKR